MPNCFSRLFSKPPIKPAEPNRPPKTFVCGLLANCVDGPAGGQITEDYIRWYLKLSDDPQYDTEHSSWLATQPFNYTIADEEKGSSVTISPNPSIDCSPATAITTFQNRLQNIIECHVRKQDNLSIVLIGIESDPTRIFIQSQRTPPFVILGLSPTAKYWGGTYLNLSSLSTVTLRSSFHRHSLSISNSGPSFLPCVQKTLLASATVPLLLGHSLLSRRPKRWTQLCQTITHRYYTNPNHTYVL